ncbi:MAG: hypothetical protein U9N46_07025 [Euryarchaeota archaeon]|nr:hypothetical protein [Euryarchaeota archaeon]
MTGEGGGWGDIEKLAEGPDGCSPDRIADETGVPLAVVLEVIGGLLE